MARAVTVNRADPGSSAKTPAQRQGHVVVSCGPWRSTAIINVGPMRRTKSATSSIRARSSHTWRHRGPVDLDDVQGPPGDVDGLPPRLPGIECPTQVVLADLSGIQAPSVMLVLVVVLPTGRGADTHVHVLRPKTDDVEDRRRNPGDDGCGPTHRQSPLLLAHLIRINGGLGQDDGVHRAHLAAASLEQRSQLRHVQSPSRFELEDRNAQLLHDLTHQRAGVRPPACAYDPASRTGRDDGCGRQDSGRARGLVSRGDGPPAASHPAEPGRATAWPRPIGRRQAGPSEPRAVGSTAVDCDG